MLANSKSRFATIGILSAGLVVVAMSTPMAGQCVDFSKNPAGCQPSTFDTPIGQIPTGRVNRHGNLDPTSSEADARAGVALLEKKLHLFRNFEHLHWVPLIPSVKDPATGAWKGGDLDGAGDGRSFGIAGNCIFVGHSAARGVTHPMNILKIQPNPERQPPVPAGEIPTPPEEVDAVLGIDDKEAHALVYEISPGENRMILVRLVGGKTVETYRIDTNTCRPIAKGATYEMAGSPHEFFLWHDPANSKRVLVFMAMWGGGTPDPEHPSLRVPDVIAFAVTDEVTGEVLTTPRVVANFSLQEVGGPPIDENPDATGLFADGRFADFSHLKTASGAQAENTTKQRNAAHSLSVSDDGERVYMAHSSAGFFVLNSEAIAHHTDADLAAGTAGCNTRSTIVSVYGTLDASKLAQVANDCLHMVVNDDPGLKAFLGFAAPDAKIRRYLTMMTRSRFDVHPPINAPVNGVHSAVVVPNRPALVKGNTKGRPAYVWLTDENFGCPTTFARIVSIEVETTPVMVGAFAVPDVQLDECLDQPRRIGQQSHNPTVFKNLVFTGWYGHGLRVTDISQPQTPREVGYALTVPNTSTRGYPILKDGLFYWADTKTGLHVARYTGPRSEELPGPGSGVYDGNTTSPHR